MRLNLAIRRNGLPEAKVVWPVPLEENPTVSKLLEQVNDIIPLESSDWGLEDYAVELSSPDGSSFECLHFQLVRTVLKEGDNVRIRPLLTNDLKQRRLSGRYQISTDGKHLIDGIPFGRPLLKAPRGRPALDIPPRKRRRIALDEGSAEDSDPEEPEQEQEQDSSMLLLTNGEENDNGARRVTINTVPQVFGDVSDDEEDSDFEEDEMEEDESDLEDEDDALDHESESDGEPHDDAMDDHEPDDNDQDEDAESEHQDSSQGEDGLGRDEEGAHKLADPQSKDLCMLDGPGLLHAAFPTITVLCDTMLAKFDGNLDWAYKALRKISEPVIPRDEFRKRCKELVATKDKAAGDAISGKAPSKKRPAQRPSPAGAPHDQAGLVDDEDDAEDNAEDDAEVDDVDEYVKKFDRRGLPPGSISTTPQAGRTKNHIVFEEEPKPTAGKPDDSSSDSQSESSDSDSDSGPEETSAKRNAKPAPRGKRGTKSDSDSEDTSSDEESSDSSDSSDEERDAEHSDSESSDEDFAPGSGAQDSDSSSSSDSDSSSSDSDQEDSGRESRNVERRSAVKENQASRDPNAPPTQNAVVPAAQESQSPSGAPQQPEKLVPPGAGKQSTKQRNARRRLAARTQKMAAQAPETDVAPDAASTQANSTSKTEPPKSTKDAEKELFEAKRKALLDALNSGGAVVGPDGELEVNEVEDTTTMSQKSNKRKHGKRSTPEPPVGDSGDKSVVTPAGQETDPDTSAQKRRRVDLGAGRRMLFGALGLRNPKTKDDESNLRAKLMENVRPLPNARLETTAAENADSIPKDATTDPEISGEDPDAWRDKIEYRAVECWYEGVDLSEPPFPFEQRWDPQQRRNGPRKAKKQAEEIVTADNDQEEETSFAGKKRKHDESVQPDEESYYSYQGQKGSQDENLRLNYDDVEPDQQGDKADNAHVDHSIAGSHYSDLDDLPSLPKDLSVLRQLQPGQARVGMVITWKQVSTSWYNPTLRIVR